MASTNSPSVRWVVGDTQGLDENNEVVDVPSGHVYQATNTTVPTAARSGAVVHITSDDDVYYWNGDEWVGPYTSA